MNESEDYYQGYKAGKKHLQKTFEAKLKESFNKGKFEGFAFSENFLYFFIILIIIVIIIISIWFYWGLSQKYYEGLCSPNIYYTRNWVFDEKKSRLVTCKNIKTKRLFQIRDYSNLNKDVEISKCAPNYVFKILNDKIICKKSDGTVYTYSKRISF
jgi:hypothetical protein